jgi:Family of unknown function (DUF6510)
MSEIDQSMDMNTQMMLDGNAVAGKLQTIFGVEMTASSIICAQCGSTSMMGKLWAFTQSPGIVLRCPACKGVMLRLVQTPQSTLLDARGVMYLKIPSYGT